MHPLGNHVLIKPVERETQMVIVDKAKEKPTEGIVKAVGSMVEEELFHDLVGKKVMFKKFAPDEFTVDGELMYLVEEPDVMCVLDYAPKA